MAEKKSEEKKKEGKKQRTKRSKSKKYSYYQIEGGKLLRERKICPKCGPGVFLAQHKNRSSCGKCGYTQYNK